VLEVDKTACSVQFFTASENFYAFAEQQALELFIREWDVRSF